MTSDDRDVTVPEDSPPLHDVARAIVRHRLNVPLTPAALDALAWAVTRTPEGRDKVLDALVETGTLTEESRQYAGHGEVWTESRLTTGWRETDVRDISDEARP